jgi:hypothetical protein
MSPLFVTGQAHKLRVFMGHLYLRNVALLLAPQEAEGNRMYLGSKHLQALRKHRKLSQKPRQVDLLKLVVVFSRLVKVDVIHG